MDGNISPAHNSAPNVSRTESLNWPERMHAKQNMRPTKQCWVQKALDFEDEAV
jgi:hypothetical protein